MEAKDENGWTPLIYASSNGHLETVRALVEECGANVETKDNAGSTAEAAAKDNGKSDVEQYLRSKASAQLSDAASKGDTAKVLKLIEDGGDIEWRNPNDVSD